MITRRYCTALFADSASTCCSTSIQSDFWPLVYPKSELPGLAIVHGLTGYMPERLLDRRLPVVPLAERKTWIAYRGRNLGIKYGRLGSRNMRLVGA